MSNIARNVLCGKNYLEGAFSFQGYNATRTFCSNEGNLVVDPLKNAKPYREMPKVTMVPFLGSSWAYLPGIGRYSINKLHKADIHKNKIYGDVVRERFGKFEVVSSYHPDTMKTLSENEGIYPCRSDFSSLKVYRQKRKEWFEPDGFLVSKGKEWLNMREGLIRYLTQPDYLKNYIDPLNEIAKDFVTLISFKIDGKQEVQDAGIHLRKWALECVTRVTLNTRLECLSLNLDSEADSMKILNALETQLECMYKLEASSGNFPLWKYFPTPTWLKFKKAADVFTSLSYKYITRAVHADTSSFQTLKGELPSFLQFILLAERARVSTAVTTVADLILAGLDTTSHTAAFLLYNLAKNPEKQELAYKEICQLLPNEEKMTFETYDKLDYLKSCLKESMRLYPTVRGNVRVLDRDVVINDYRVPSGTAIICVHQVIHRNEKYFKNADQFRPERWINEEATNINEFAYQPFGYGKRNCLGKNLAEMEIVTLITEVLRKYAVEYNHGDLDMYTRLINVPDKPLRLKFVERKLPRQF